MRSVEIRETPPQSDSVSDGCQIVMMRTSLSIALITFILIKGSVSVHIFQTSQESYDETKASKVYDVKWYNQTLDHFSFTTTERFQQKYLVNDSYWDKAGGPIFFYTGNEGDIEAFAQNSVS